MEPLTLNNSQLHILRLAREYESISFQEDGRWVPGACKNKNFSTEAIHCLVEAGHLEFFDNGGSVRVTQRSVEPEAVDRAEYTDRRFIGRRTFKSTIYAPKDESGLMHKVPHLSHDHNRPTRFSQ